MPWGNRTNLSKYRIVSSLPADLKGRLPDPEQIARLLENYEETVRIETEKPVSGEDAKARRRERYSDK